jgi:hypothetical protein
LCVHSLNSYQQGCLFGYKAINGFEGSLSIRSFVLDGRGLESEPHKLEERVEIMHTPIPIAQHSTDESYSKTSDPHYSSNSKSVGPA